MVLEDARPQYRALRRGHLLHAKWIENARIFLLDYVGRPAERLLEDTQGRAPRKRVPVTEMRGKRLDRRRHELFECSGARFGLRRLARPATEVAAGAAGFT
jgi:hypothetical protein